MLPFLALRMRFASLRSLVRWTWSLLLLVPCSGAAAQPAGPAVPADFARLSEVAPTIRQDIRYVTDQNFVGRPIHGYEAGACYLTRPAADALAKVQADLEPMGLSLLVFDCYRPQRAVNHFVRWAQDLGDTTRKAVQYPDVPKSRLFADGYIASRSGHSRGSTVDLTIMPAGAPLPDEPGDVRCDDPASPQRQQPLDMGTAYDCFSTRSHTASEAVSPSARAHRLLLKTLMERHGFRNYWKEWWHYTLRNEPHPETYFDFVVR